jgi:hypothetical protein
MLATNPNNMYQKNRPLVRPTVMGAKQYLADAMGSFSIKQSVKVY